MQTDRPTVQSNVPNRFNISFNGLRPDAACSCELSIEPATGYYKVVATDPATLELCESNSHGDFVDKVQNLLNQTQDLSGFVVALRRRFRAVLAAPSRVVDQPVDAEKVKPF